MRLHRMTYLALVPLLGLAACGGDDDDDDPLAPSTAEVAGSYEAIVFTFTEAGSERDVLEEGGFIEIVLDENGTTEGTLFVPDGAEGGGDFEADLTGTWNVDGDQVAFDHEADTFLRDLAFEWMGSGILSAVTPADNGTLRVTLSRGDPFAI